MPDVLHPDVGTGREEQPVNWYEEKADHVAGEGNADEENWKSLKINIYKNKYIYGRAIVLTSPWYLKLS